MSNKTKKLIKFFDGPNKYTYKILLFVFILRLKIKFKIKTEHAPEILSYN